MTRYPQSERTPLRIERHRIERGLAGTRTTVAHVGRLIREGARDFFVRQKAIDILLANAVPAKDYATEIEVLFKWVQRHVRYTKDPFQVEVLHTPRRMLELRAGDCDDMTILLGALLKSVGHPVRIVLSGPDARRPDLFSHIYLEAQHQGNWIPLDATMPYAMGWSPRAPVRMVLSVDEETADDRPTTARPSTARPTTPRGTTARPGADAHTRVAAESDPQRPKRGSRAARPAREGAVGRVAATTAALAEPVAGARTASDVGPWAVAETATAQRTTIGLAPAGMGRVADAGGAIARIAPRCAATATQAHAIDHHAAPAAAGKGTPRRHTLAPSAGTTGAIAAYTTPPGPAHAIAAASHARAGALTTTTRDAWRDSVKDASRLHETFTQHAARSCERVQHQRVMPSVVVGLGELVALVYRSDKWVGYPRTYIHYMEEPPRLVSDTSGRQLFLVGGNYRVTARGIEG